jgi:hypothetical protein
VEASPDGTRLYVTGSFNTINGVTKRKIASISPTTGAPVAGSTANAGAQATALAATNSAGQHMSSSGAFTCTNQRWRSAFLNSPGTPGSNFSHTTPVIPSGACTVRRGRSTPTARSRRSRGRPT